MRLRFLRWIAVLGVLLGMMLTILTGHVRQAARDWYEANYRMGEGAYKLYVIPNPAGDAPNPRRSAAINAELRALLTGRDAVVVLDGEDHDGPRVGLYDPRDRLGLVHSAEGALHAGDFGQEATKAVIRDDSYLVGREQRYIPPDVEVVGYFSGDAMPFTQEYVYTVFSQDNVHGTYYISAEAEIVAGFEQALRRGDYLVDSQPIESNVFAIIQSEALTYAYEISLLLVYGTALLLYLNWGAANRRRYDIEYRYGAHPLAYSLRMMQRIIIPTALGTALGAGLAMLILHRLDIFTAIPSLTDMGVLTVANTVTLCALFLLALIIQTRAWGRS